MRTLRTIPAVSTLAELLDLINERFRTFNSADGGDAFSGDMSGQRIKNVGTPTENTDAATAGWADARFARKGEGGGTGAPGPPGPPGSNGDTIVHLSGASGAVTPDHADGTVFIIAVTGPFTLAAPAGVVDQKRFFVRMNWDASGGHVVTMDAWYGPLRNLGPDREMVARPGWAHMLSGIADGSNFVLFSQDSIGE